jgi:isoleucyl-tRNA synthetase
MEKDTTFSFLFFRAITLRTTPVQGLCIRRPVTGADFDVWTSTLRVEQQGYNTYPYTVDENGAFTEQAPGFASKRVSTTRARRRRQRGCHQGAGGQATSSRVRGSSTSIRVVAIEEAGDLPQLPQWFIAMDKPIRMRQVKQDPTTLRNRAFAAIRPPLGAIAGRTASPA